MKEKGNIALIILSVLLLVSIVGVGAYLLGSGKLSGVLNSGGVTPAQMPVVYQTPTPPPAAIPTSLSDEPMSGWKTYNDKESKYSFKYPQELSLKEYEDGTVSVYLWGPTQKEGTEFYDGISLNFRKGSLEGKTLKGFVDQKVSELSGVFEVGAVSQVTLSGLTAHKFHVKGYVEGDYYYLSLGTDSYLEIIDSTKDPTNKDFVKTASEILSTLKII